MGIASVLVFLRSGESCRTHSSGRGERSQTWAAGAAGLPWAHGRVGRQARLGPRDMQKCPAVSPALWSAWMRRSGLQEEMVSDCPAVTSEVTGGGLLCSIRVSYNSTTSFAGLSPQGDRVPLFMAGEVTGRPQTGLFTHGCPSEGDSIATPLWAARASSGLVY